MLSRCRGNGVERRVRRRDPSALMDGWAPRLKCGGSLHSIQGPGAAPCQRPFSGQLRGSPSGGLRPSFRGCFCAYLVRSASGTASKSWAKTALLKKKQEMKCAQKERYKYSGEISPLDSAACALCLLYITRWLLLLPAPRCSLCKAVEVRRPLTSAGCRHGGPKAACC